LVLECQSTLTGQSSGTLGVMNAPAIDSQEAQDDVMILPWWQNPLNIITMLVAIALIAGMGGWLWRDAAEPRPNAVDIGFLQDMREHHENAVAISFVFLDLPETRPALRTVARSIIFGQGIDIGRMIQMLREMGQAEANMGDTSMTWMGMSAAVGSMPGIATESQLNELSQSSGPEANQLFVDLMIAHHLGALEMAEYALGRADIPEVQGLAGSIVAAQQGEIAELRKLWP
jgi:uncharacterized protein (DUF305 family)